MNEGIFFLQTLIVVGFSILALKLGNAALTTWIAMQAILANLFVLKQIQLFGFDVTASDVFAIGSLLGLNFLQEYYGKAQAKIATWISFSTLIFFTLISKLHLLYTPSPSDVTQSAFSTLLTHYPRLFVASMLVFFLVQQFDIWFFSILKQKSTTLSFANRVFISLVLSQLLDTALFSFFGLYGIVESIIDIFIISYAVKLVVIATQHVFIKWLKTSP